MAGHHKPSRRKFERALVLVGLILLAAVPSRSTDPTRGETTAAAPPIVGNWRCESGPCLDEEIQFALDDGERIYNSWLHARPSASGGRWSLEGDVLKITCCGGLEMSQTVVAVDASTLELRDFGDAPETESALYSRIE